VDPAIIKYNDHVKVIVMIGVTEPFQASDFTSLTSIRYQRYQEQILYNLIEYSNGMAFFLMRACSHIQLLYVINFLYKWFKFTYEHNI